jgi:hypothetical protein
MKVKAIVVIVRNNSPLLSFDIEGESKYEVNRKVNTYVRNMRCTGLYSDKDTLIVEYPHD